MSEAFEQERAHVCKALNDLLYCRRAPRCDVYAAYVQLRMLLREALERDPEGSPMAQMQAIMSREDCGTIRYVMMARLRERVDAQLGRSCGL